VRAGTPGAGTILVVEDEPTVRELAVRILTDRGYGILTAGNGEEATEVAARHPGPIDLLLTDVVMPGMSGPQLFEVLAESRPDLKVLYMSGYPAGSGSLRDLLRGNEVFLPKPFSLSKLTMKVEEVMAADRRSTRGSKDPGAPPRLGSGSR
jgi:two-component system cell cycle sensor histidine kinase/response regulator CckA